MQTFSCVTTSSLLRRWAAFDGVLPPLPGWPRHPLAPSQLSSTQLEHETETLALQLVALARDNRTGAISALAREHKHRGEQWAGPPRLLELGCTHRTEARDEGVEAGSRGELEA